MADASLAPFLNSNSNALPQAYGAAAARQGDLDVADASLAAIDEEKDPRCLLLAFRVVQVREGGFRI